MKSPSWSTLGLALTLLAPTSSLQAGKILASSQSRAKISSQAVETTFRSVLPLVGLKQEEQDYSFLGNAVLMDDQGYMVIPASVLKAVPASLLIPVPRLGVLVPAGNDRLDRPVAETRVFQSIRVIYMGKKSELALIKLEGPLREARPVTGGGFMGLGQASRVLGFGKPGVLRYLFGASVAARIPTEKKGSTAFRYALDARVTEASDGGLAFDEQGKVQALTLFHLKNLHRVVHKQADFEYGPTGSALGIPLDEVRSWVNRHLPVVAEKKIEVEVKVEK
jgi:hypothetical protein